MITLVQTLGYLDEDDEEGVREDSSAGTEWQRSSQRRHVESFQGDRPSAAVKRAPFVPQTPFQADSQEEHQLELRSEEGIRQGGGAEQMESIIESPSTASVAVASAASGSQDKYSSQDPRCSGSLGERATGAMGSAGDRGTGTSFIHWDTRKFARSGSSIPTSGSRSATDLTQPPSAERLLGKGTSGPPSMISRGRVDEEVEEEEEENISEDYVVQEEQAASTPPADPAEPLGAGRSVGSVGLIDGRKESLSRINLVITGRARSVPPNVSGSTLVDDDAFPPRPAALHPVLNHVASTDLNPEGVTDSSDLTLEAQLGIITASSTLFPLRKRPQPMVPMTEVISPPSPSSRHSSGSHPQLPTSFVTSGLVPIRPHSPGPSFHRTSSLPVEQPTSSASPPENGNRVLNSTSDLLVPSPTDRDDQVTVGHSSRIRLLFFQH